MKENHRCVVHKTTNFVKYQHDKGANPSEAMKQACCGFFLLLVLKKVIIFSPPVSTLNQYFYPRIISICFIKH